MIKRMLLIMSLTLVSGCSFISIGGGSSVGEKAPRDLQRRVNDLHDVPPPSKSIAQTENERIAVAMVKRRVDDAHDISTELPVKTNLTVAQKLLAALERSMGAPTKEVEASIDEVDKLIKSMDRENEELKEKQEEYKKLMDENRQTIAQLQGLLNTKIEREETLLDKIKFWFWIAVAASIALAVFVPGGMFLVNRFWSKTGEIVISGAKTATHAIGEISHSIARYAETLGDDEREKLKKHLRTMSSESQGFWDDVRKGNNPMVRKLHRLPKKLRDKYLDP